jgi:3-phenylpropionate/trans-cinnamate dioxygenase ferredoxin component
MDGYTFVGKTDEFEEEDMEQYTVNGYPVLLNYVEGEFYACHAICSHEYAELIDGDLDGHTITCPLHFACFDVRNGTVLESPATKPLPVFEVKIQNDEIWIKNEPKGGKE